MQTLFARRSFAILAMALCLWPRLLPGLAQGGRGRFARPMEACVRSSCDTGARRQQLTMRDDCRTSVRRRPGRDRAFGWWCSKDGLLTSPPKSFRVLAPSACFCPTVSAQTSTGPGHQARANFVRDCFDDGCLCRSDPFEEALLTTWRTRATYATFHSSSRTPRRIAFGIPVAARRFWRRVHRRCPEPVRLAQHSSRLRAAIAPFNGCIARGRTYMSANEPTQRRARIVSSRLIEYTRHFRRSPSAASVADTIHRRG